MKLILMFSLTIAAALAEPVATVTKALQNQPLTAEEGKELVQLCFGKKGDLEKILKTKMEPELVEKGNKVAQKMAASTKEDDGKNRLGGGLSWYLKYDGDVLSSYPILARIRKDSAAEKAQCLTGDVVAAAAGFSLLHPESRNRFAQLLMIWPSGTPLQLNLLRSPSRKNLNENHPREAPHSVTVTLSTKDAE